MKKYNENNNGGFAAHTYCGQPKSKKVAFGGIQTWATSVLSESRFQNKRAFGSVGKAAPSDTRGPIFESGHQSHFRINILTFF